MRGNIPQVGARRQMFFAVLSYSMAAAGQSIGDSLDPVEASPSPSAPQATALVIKPTRARYIVLAFLCALSFLTYFDRVCIVRAQADIQRDLGLDDQQIGFILSAFWLAYALFEVPGGSMGDRHGPRRTLSRIVLAWSVFTALSGMAIGFSSLLACRFLFGVGEAGAYPNIARIQSRWLPARARARAGGGHLAGCAVGRGVFSGHSRHDAAGLQFPSVSPIPRAFSKRLQRGFMEIWVFRFGIGGADVVRAVLPMVPG